jgi:hypothetical protein
LAGQQLAGGVSAAARHDAAVTAGAGIRARRRQPDDRGMVAGMDLGSDEIAFLG